MSSFNFKQFTILQQDSAMKVGVDGVLLGAWAFSKGKVEHILDIGVGTGLISIMMAQRFPEALITGVEIDEAACFEAIENAKRSPWSNRIKIINSDFLQLDEKSSDYDLIISNPPYYEKGWPVEDEGRRKARDAASLPLVDLFQRAAKISGQHTVFCLILPALALDNCLQTAAINGWFSNRITTVHTKPEKPAKRVLIAFGRSESGTSTDELTIYDANGNYSEAYKKLTGDFYLAF